MKCKTHKYRLHDQNGAVAMLSVVIFAIIITVVATSYIKTVISQQRNALNYDNGTQAYYAAESGVQDGARLIQTSSTVRKDGKKTCDPVAPNATGTVGPTGYGLNYTCQLIDVSPSSIEGSVTPSQKTAMIKIEPLEPYTGTFSIGFRWSKKDTDATATALTGRSSKEALFPSVSKWGSNGNDADNFPIHAVLRANVITHPKANFQRDEISQRVMFLNPASRAALGGGVGTSPTINKLAGAEEQQEQLFWPAVCYSSSPTDAGEFEGFSCTRTVNFSGYDLKNNDLYVNIGSVYKETDFSIVVKDASNNILPLINTQASIDVTAKAGSATFRRVRQTLPLGGYLEKDGSDAALVVGEGICKQFSVGNTTSLYDSSCNPLTD